MRISIDNFLTLVKCYNDKYLIDDCLSYMFDFFDSQLLFKKDFEYCDSVLREINPNDYRTEILIGFLNITFVWKDYLTTRDDLYDRIEKHLERDYNIESIKLILQGLK